MSYQASVPHADADGDFLDRVIAVAWVASVIGLDVFGMLFWSAIGLSVLSLFA